MSKHKKHKQYEPDDNNKNQQNQQYNPPLNNMGLDRLVRIMGNIDINKLSELLNNFNFSMDNTEPVNQKNSVKNKDIKKEEFEEDIKDKDYEFSKNKDIIDTTDIVLPDNQGVIINEDKIKNLLIALKNIADEKSGKALQKLLDIYLSK